MSDMKRIKIARKLAYNVFEKTGKIEDYKTYKNIDNLVKSYEKENEFNGYGM
ncbi:MAG: hypothetical protein IJA23_03050 [Clostridia bacterium]|nr:hypothetical protein [Clostridia bacterium]